MLVHGVLSARPLELGGGDWRRILAKTRRTRRTEGAARRSFAHIMQAYKEVIHQIKGDAGPAALQFESRCQRSIPQEGERNAVAVDVLIVNGRDRSRAGFRYRIFSGLNAGWLDRANRENVASLRAWVAQRARTLLPGRTIDRAEFRWYLDTLRTDENSNEVFKDSHLDGTLAVDLLESIK